MPEEFPIFERAMWPAVRMAICIPLAMLEPAIIQANLAGQQPTCMSLLWVPTEPAADRLGGTTQGGGRVDV